MTTDIKQTGVPSATRGRMQLANPVQTANSGRVAQNPQATEQRMQSRLSESYNPIMAKGENEAMPRPAVSNTASMAQPQLSQTRQSRSYDDLANGVSVDQFGRYLSELPEKDQMRFFENFANGTYKSQVSSMNNQVTPTPTESMVRR